MKILTTYNQGNFPWSVFRVDHILVSRVIRAGTTPYMKYDFVRKGKTVGGWTTHRGAEKRGHEYMAEFDRAFDAAQVRTPKFDLGTVSPGDIKSSRNVEVSCDCVIADGSGATSLPDWTEQAFTDIEAGADLKELTDKYQGQWTSYSPAAWIELHRDVRTRVESDIAFYGDDFVVNYVKP